MSFLAIGRKLIEMFAIEKKTRLESLTIFYIKTILFLFKPKKKSNQFHPMKGALL